MDSPATTVRIELGERAYPVHIGAGELSRLGERLAERNWGRRALLITNSAIAARYGAVVQESLRQAGLTATLVTVPAGERAKKLATVETLCDAAIAAGLDRKDTVIALGGGVIGDLAGFTASALYRGVRLVQLPTTLVAMVDSSVGGKTGVNSKLGKNLIGAFWQPSLVCADLSALASLPPRERRCGMAEVIKHGAILDAAMFERLERELVEHPVPGDLSLTATVGLTWSLAEYCVSRSCELKGAVVAADEREAGQRAWLNYGHTFGHALEVLCGYGKLHHGEAVAVGMVLAARLGQMRGELSADDVARIERLPAAVGLPTRLPAGTDPDEVFALMHRDKKVLGGKLRLVVLERLGQAAVAEDTPPELVRDLLRKAGREAGHAG